MDDEFAKSKLRSLSFNGLKGARYWWFQDKSYIPPIFSFLKSEEWDVLNEWYIETDQKNLAAETNVPMMSILQGFIMGNNISSVVQLGHFSGYSTLLIGFMLRSMNRKKSFVTVDIDEYLCEFTQSWVERAELTEYVRVERGDSSESSLVDLVLDHFGERPRLIFIDSSHQYEHTLKELDIWFRCLAEGGLIILHDTSQVAVSFDTTGKGGVKRAFEEWMENNKKYSGININGSPDADYRKRAYLDGCGIGIFQK
jgi:predicted O-methyltransferase YrrM